MSWPQQLILVIVIFLIAFVGMTLQKKISQKLHERKHGRELPDPFFAEVIYRGAVVATLTDRQFCEMFWYRYRINAVSPEGQAIIENADHWNACRFLYRDPVSGDMCYSCFGPAPPRDGWVRLRGMYFGGRLQKPRDPEAPEYRPSEATPPSDDPPA